jgi:hypothetical protein
MYGAAKKEILPGVEHRQHKRLKIHISQRDNKKSLRGDSNRLKRLSGCYQFIGR